MPISPSLFVKIHAAYLYDWIHTYGDIDYLIKIKKKKGWYKRHRNRIKFNWFNAGIEYPTHKRLRIDKMNQDEKEGYDLWYQQYVEKAIYVKRD